MRSGLLLCSLMIVATPTLAVYKCNTSGGILYTDVPCGGTQTELMPPPFVSDPAAARRLAQEEKKQLSLIEKAEVHAQSDRRRQETGREKVAATIKKRCTLLGLEKKWSAEDAATASHLVSEKSETLKRQARRKAERYEAECQKK
jgi:hypothetical protein